MVSNYTDEFDLGYQFLAEDPTAAVNAQVGAGAPKAAPSSFAVPITAIFGALSGAIGSFYALDAQKHRAKMAASAMKHAARMNEINARQAEADARDSMRAGHAEIGRLTMQAGAEKSSRRASMASRGIRLGIGSTRDVQATGDLMKELDVNTINLNAVRASNARRRQATNFRSQSAAQQLSSSNLRASGSTISPLAGFGQGLSTSLLSTAKSLSPKWNTDFNTRGTA